MITDKNARLVYIEYMLDESSKRVVLVVETDLQLDPAEPDFEANKVGALCNDLDKHRKETSHIDAIRLVRRSSGPERKPIELSGLFGRQQIRTTLKPT